MLPIFIVALSIGMFLFGCSYSDADLKEKFQRHKMSLDQLVNLAETCWGDKEKKLIWASKVSLSEQPCANLMIPMGIESIFKNEKGVIFFSTPSGFGGSKQKGYAYSQNPISPLLSSLDAPDVEPYDYVYKDLGDGWYLYFMNANG